MADVQILAPGTVAAPLTYTVPGAQEILLKAVAATFDGTGAGGSFVPSLQFIAPSGVTALTCPLTTTLAAGASTDTSWFPGVVPPTVAQGSGIPPFNALDDYVFKNANTTITGVGHSDTTNLIIQGNTVTLDGLTRVKVEFFTPSVENSGTPPNNQAVGFELWDSFNGGAITDKGTIAYVIGNTKASALTLDAGGPVYGAVILTPAAGTHKFAVYAWKNVAGGTSVVYANTFIDGTGNFAPSWYRVTTT